MQTVKLEMDNLAEISRDILNRVNRSNDKVGTLEREVMFYWNSIHLPASELGVMRHTTYSSQDRIEDGLEMWVDVLRVIGDHIFTEYASDFPRGYEINVIDDIMFTPVIPADERQDFEGLQKWRMEKTYESPDLVIWKYFPASINGNHGYVFPVWICVKGS